MKEDIEMIIAEFDNIAAKIYSDLFLQFSESIQRINREKEENIFKMQAAKFIDTLKYLLDDQVRNLLGVSDPKIHHQLEAALSTKGNYSLKEVQVKCNAL